MVQVTRLDALLFAGHSGSGSGVKVSASLYRDAASLHLQDIARRFGSLNLGGRSETALAMGEG